MYEQHFGFSEKPFGLTPDPRFLFLTRHHQMALTAMEYGLAGDALITVLTGEVGSGKTTLVRHFTRSLAPDIRVGVITNMHRGSGKLLQWVLMALGLVARRRDVAGLYGRFIEHLDSETSAGRRVLLIVDEAQNLGAPRLEELRVLSNVNDTRPLALQLVLVGQPELRSTLRKPKLRQLAQRVGADYHLGALSRDETRDYVRHRLQIVGARSEVFSTGAIDIVHLHSGGVPRLINQLCDTALVYSLADQRNDVDAGLMEQVVTDRATGGIFPDATRRDSSRRSVAG
jgi:type II secretory pathway predicted ATPase ExeA